MRSADTRRLNNLFFCRSVNKITSPNKFSIMPHDANDVIPYPSIANIRFGKVSELAIYNKILESSYVFQFHLLRTLIQFPQYILTVFIFKNNYLKKNKYQEK